MGGGAALIRGQRLLTFLSHMRRLFEGGAYSSKYGSLFHSLLRNWASAILLYLLGGWLCHCFDESLTRIGRALVLTLSPQLAKNDVLIRKGAA